MRAGPCANATTSSKIKLTDVQSQTAIIENMARDQFILIKFDGCVICNATACDWLLIGPNDQFLAVELKGCDVDHAVEQIEAAFIHLRSSGEQISKLAGLVICSRYPRIDTKIQRLKQRLARRFMAPLHIKTDGRDLKFSEFFRY